ncbi:MULTISPECIES: carbapenem-hydrolyzing class A beta-lactamase BKC-1 [Gammaproteobacteria]|uniref:Beta-lactamase n=2 Tax=Gammaproteobacteria TaxID=1236 RepID=A0A0F6QEY8_KLEPN|nr:MULTISPECIES: carbapenem-hydrolyzing class A beta-lactamase BKC-1 [Gammaproteobacteria]AKD43328.1 bKC-1 [Klebsiella pneumoniae]MBA6145724.1 carbapenem-hydrolyzing class A beta-lactamase BKC-1 [Pseudomonas juntendi]MCZ9641064.1 carbapenem-hydrolyzing class A beta-lactamase BKC-1 [Pseudomonas putida]MCZ9641137.1 carbapenem-hydrolyzing class A beta-lactamase BKC-1 [Pseudomonas putida]MDE9097984.1 carbapenem-hydrolyzing class A beta-lactamase BKC-1 [Klebsiella pneumoniae]
MTITFSRRQAIAGALLAVPAVSTLAASAGALLAVPAVSTLAASAGAATGGPLEKRLAELEGRHKGRIGVAIHNLATGARIGHRADERFLMCSTFKALLAAHILARVDRKEETLDRRIVVGKSDLVDWSPVVETRVGGEGISIAELCEAAITLSDNAAANLLLSASGGPKAVTQFLRGFGDDVTRLDRTEPTLNYRETPDDERDTTTPAAMAETLRKLIIGDVLARGSKAQLAAWLVMNKTGDTRLRAGFPVDWTTGDKTGTNGDRHGNANDVAIAWSPDRGAVVVTAFCEIPGISGDERNAVIAEIGRIAAEA